MFRSRSVLPFALVALTTTPLAHGQSLTSRQSSLSYQLAYGGGEEAYTLSETQSADAVTSTGALAAAFADGRSGFINNDSSRPWSAGVGLELSQQYAITGPLSEFSRIVASGFTQVSAAATGEGYAVTSVGSQGNALDLRFTMSTTSSARLSGSVDLDPSGTNLYAWVTLERFDGIVWANMFTSLFLPGQEGNFDVELSLIPGDYRLVSEAAGYATPIARPLQTNLWSYDLQIVPAPGGIALLVMAGGFMRGRRRS